jgi:hypothetical protein
MSVQPVAAVISFTGTVIGNRAGPRERGSALSIQDNRGIESMTC